ncbi:hypothetical protein FACS1894106_1450 [Spirochaetia bacterium]|nr:hypothetical protein FACS1894106_1450 [Spirochaetia bacterium]
MKTIRKFFHALHVKIGHGLYRASISFKDFGDRVRITPHYWYRQGRAGTFDEVPWEVRN